MPMRILGACMALLLAFGSAAQGRASETKQYHGVGIIRGFEKKGAVVVIEHHAIIGLMEGMTMPFELADASLAKGLAVGDRVAFTLSRRGDFYPIVAIRKLASKARARRSPTPTPAPTAVAQWP